MSRFDLYGGIKCEDCQYYRKSTRCHHMRCIHDDNIADPWLGLTIYKEQPDSINWDSRCKMFKGKVNGTRTRKM